MAERAPFVAVFYSDGTYDAHHKFHASHHDEGAKKAEPVYGFVFDDEPIKGEWETADGEELRHLGRWLFFFIFLMENTELLICFSVLRALKKPLYEILVSETIFLL